MPGERGQATAADRLGFKMDWGAVKEDAENLPEGLPASLAGLAAPKVVGGVAGALFVGAMDCVNVVVVVAEESSSNDF